MRNQDSFLREALLHPHDGLERVDQDYVVAYRCERCDKVGMGPRKHMQEAIAEHNRRCAVLNRDGTANVARIFYPRSS